MKNGRSIRTAQWLAAGPMLALVLATPREAAAAVEYAVYENIGPQKTVLNAPGISDNFGTSDPVSGAQTAMSGSASIGEGALKVFAESTHGNGLCCDFGVNVAVGFGDTLLFENLTGAIHVTLIMTIDGSVSSLDNYGQLDFREPGSFGFTFQGGTHLQSTTFANPNGLSIPYVLTAHPLADGSAAVPFEVTLTAFVSAPTEGGRSFADFSHTARLSIESPVPFTSASGVLLTQAVPLPLGVWLLGSGMLALQISSRRRTNPV